MSIFGSVGAALGGLFSSNQRSFDNTTPSEGLSPSDSDDWNARADPLRREWVVDTASSDNANAESYQHWLRSYQTEQERLAEHEARRQRETRPLFESVNTGPSLEQARMRQQLRAAQEQQRRRMNAQMERRVLFPDGLDREELREAILQSTPDNQFSSQSLVDSIMNDSDDLHPSAEDLNQAAPEWNRDYSGLTAESEDWPPSAQILLKRSSSDGRLFIEVVFTTGERSSITLMLEDTLVINVNNPDDYDNIELFNMTLHKLGSNGYVSLGFQGIHPGFRGSSQQVIPIGARISVTSDEDDRMNIDWAMPGESLQEDEADTEWRPRENAPLRGDVSDDRAYTTIDM